MGVNAHKAIHHSVCGALGTRPSQVRGRRPRSEVAHAGQRFVRGDQTPYVQRSNRVKRVAAGSKWRDYPAAAEGLTAPPEAFHADEEDMQAQNKDPEWKEQYEPIEKLIAKRRTTPIAYPMTTNQGGPASVRRRIVEPAIVNTAAIRIAGRPSCESVGA
jgi:hypothetical protein